MKTTVPTVTDVYRGLLRRIRTHVYAPGSRLPSVRELAEELGSNPSTVDRAIHRLVELGVVRTVPRRGAFVTSTVATPEQAHDLIAEDVRAAVIQAWNSGLSPERIRELVDAAIDTRDNRPRIAFIECNIGDAQRMVRLIANASGVELHPVLLDDCEGRSLDEEFDAIAAPTFHLADLAPFVTSYDRVVDVNFVASPAVLRRLATVGTDKRVAVAAPTERGITRMVAMVGQYHAGDIQPYRVGIDDPAMLATVDVIVHNNAAPLPQSALDNVTEVISVQWELDTSSSGRFRARIDDVLAQPRLSHR